MSEIVHLDPEMAEELAETPEVQPEVKDEKPSESAEEHEEGGEEEHEDKPKKKTGSQRAREIAQRERERAARLEGENEALRRQLGIKPEEKKVLPAGKPRVDDFDTHEAFVEALTDWKVDQKFQAQTQKQDQTSKNQTWEQRKEAARSKYEDFDEVLDASGDVPMSPVMAEAMLGSEVGGDLAYHFATHPEDAKKIAAMSAYEAGRAIAKIEAGFSTQPKPKPTSAPKPPSPVKTPASAPPRDADGFEVY